jgi:hypothetical protein
VHEHPDLIHPRKSCDTGALNITDFLTGHQFHRRGLRNSFYPRLGVKYQVAARLIKQIALMGSLFSGRWCVRDLIKSLSRTVP